MKMPRFPPRSLAQLPEQLTFSQLACPQNAEDIGTPPRIAARGSAVGAESERQLDVEVGGEKGDRGDQIAANDAEL